MSLISWCFPQITALQAFYGHSDHPLIPFVSGNRKKKHRNGRCSCTSGSVLLFVVGFLVGLPSHIWLGKVRECVWALLFALLMLLCSYQNLVLDNRNLLQCFLILWWLKTKGRLLLPSVFAILQMKSKEHRFCLWLERKHKQPPWVLE